MSKSKKFQPPWLEQVASPRSYRSLYKWGHADGFKHPNRGMYQMLKDIFELSDDDFQAPVNTGLEEFKEEIPSQMDIRHIARFQEIVGEENVSLDTYQRTRSSYGAGMMDALRVRNKIFENLADIVLSPKRNQEIAEILAYSRLSYCL